MTQRITASTDLVGTSANWTPAGTGDILLQASTSAVDPVDLVVELQARNNASAPWAAVAAWRPGSEPFLKAVHFPDVRLAWRGNKATLNVWDAE
jgi:hypothetical protein